MEKYKVLPLIFRWDSHVIIAAKGKKEEEEEENQNRGIVFNFTRLHNLIPIACYNRFLLLKSVFEHGVFCIFGYKVQV